MPCAGWREGKFVRSDPGSSAGFAGIPAAVNGLRDRPRDRGSAGRRASAPHVDADPVHTHLVGWPRIMGEEHPAVAEIADRGVAEAPLVHVVPVLAEVDVLAALAQAGAFVVHVDHEPVGPRLAAVRGAPKGQAARVFAVDDKGEQRPVGEEQRGGDLPGQGRGGDGFGVPAGVGERTRGAVDGQVALGGEVVGPEEPDPFARAGAGAEPLVPVVQPVLRWDCGLSSRGIVIRLLPYFLGEIMEKDASRMICSPFLRLVSRAR